MIIKKFVSKDGSVKRLHKMSDGELVESVLIPHSRQNTLCVSTQAGCMMKCVFCLSGKRFGRNLTVDEILGQIVGDVDSIVFMGMGEPLDNPNLFDAIEKIKNNGIPSRKIVVSTVGLIDKMDLLLPTKVNIAVSLHATTQEQRAKLIPVANKYPLELLSKKMFELDEKLPSSRRLQIEYVLIKGLNDTPEDAKRFAKLVPKRSLVNLIPINGEGFTAPNNKEAWAFKKLLMSEGYICYVREARGEDVGAACGMLAGQS